MPIYTVAVAPAQAAHAFLVTLDIAAPSAEQRVSLPVWIPGSYLVREFARHLSGLQAEQDGAAVAVRQLDKATWAVDCAAGRPLRLGYRVYAFDTSVRAAFLDDRRGFFNGTSLCLRVEGREADRHRLCLSDLPAGWQVATAMPWVDAAAQVYEAAGYDAFVDHPVELGVCWRGQFTLRGAVHEVVVAGAWPDADLPRLLADIQHICAAEMSMWHGPDETPPFERYVFLLNLVDDGYGGLEHRASTALIAARRDLPQRGMADSSDGYVTLLGLVSHEYFHTWNVKRLRPAAFERYDYTGENYTELLWFFEGFTSYYDDLLLLRAGRIDAARYLKLIARTITSVQAMPGRRVQSVAQASFDAWVKYYRTDENTPNATVSYYTKGALVALALDLRLREAGASLDAVMRQLWTQSGAASGCGPIGEADVLAAVRAHGGDVLAADLHAWVHGTDDLPLEPLLAAVAVRWTTQAPTAAQRLGVRASESALTGCRITHVLQGSLGERAGLSAGDELWAASGWRVRRLDDLLRLAPPGQPARLLVARDQRVVELAFDWPVDSGVGMQVSADGDNRAAAHADTGSGAVVLDLATEADAAALARRRAWLGG